MIVSIRWTFCVTLLLTTSIVPLVNANPVAPTVVAGQASVQGGAGQLTITQTSAKAIVNWQDFSIGKGETTQFIQPTSSSAILNRVTGSNASSLLGRLQANGQVFLINPNGIIFGKGSVVNVGGFAASTLDVSDAQFMAKGDLVFAGSSKQKIINSGAIYAKDGDVILMASQVENNGQLKAPNGVVALGAGETIRLTQKGDERLSVLTGVGDGKVSNQGQISAVQAELKADGGNPYSLAINNTGVVNATGIVQRNGRVLLSAGGGSLQNSGQLTAANIDGSGGVVKLESGPNGTTVNSGAIKVIGTGIGKKGGLVEVLGGKTHLTSSSSIDASGDAGGGKVLVGGDVHGANPAVQNAQTTSVDAGSEIKAAATVAGKGGQVVIWSEKSTDFEGRIEAQGGAVNGDGGSAEISSRESLTFNGIAELNGPNGANGKLLLDPNTITIKEGTGTGTTIGGDSVIYQSQLEAQTADITLEATSSITTAANNPASPFFVLLKQNVSFDAFLDGPGTIDLSQADFISSLSQSSSATFLIGQPGDNATVNILVHGLVSGTGGVNIYGDNRTINGSISGQFVTIRPGGTIQLNQGAAVSTFGGDVNFLAPVSIASNQAITVQNDLDANLGSVVNFSSTINGAANLTIKSSGNVTIGAAVGGTTALNALDIHTPTSVILPTINARTVNVGAETTGGQLAPSAISQSGPMVTTTFSATSRGDITLTDAGNQITNLNTTTFKSNLQLTDSIDLSVVGAITGDAGSSQLTINDQGGAITLSAAQGFFAGASLSISGVSAPSTPNNLILSSDVGIFNNVGASVLTVNNGARWLIFAPSSDPSVLKLNGLTPAQTTTGAYPTLPGGTDNTLVLQNSGGGMAIQVIDIVAGNNAADDALLNDGKILFSDTTATGIATISQDKLDSLSGNIILQAQQSIDLGLGADLDLTGVPRADSILFQTRTGVGDNLTFGSNISTAGGAISLFSPTLILTHDVNLSTGNQSSVTFQGTVESQAGLNPALAVTSGAVTFSNSVGATHPLASLYVISAHDIQVSGNITTFGNQTYRASGTNLLNGDLNAGGAIQINGATVVEKNGIVLHSTGSAIGDGVRTNAITTQGNTPENITIESDSLNPNHLSQGGIQVDSVNASGGYIDLRADTILFGSAQSNGGKLILQQRDGNGTLTVGNSTAGLTGDLLLPQSQLDRINSNIAELDLGVVGSGRVKVEDTVLPLNSVIFGNTINIYGAVTQPVASQTLTLNGATEFDGGSLNLNSAVTFLGAVKLNTNTTTIFAKNIDLSGQPIDSIATNSNLTLLSLLNVNTGSIGLNGRLASLAVGALQINLADLNVGSLNIATNGGFTDTQAVTVDQATINTVGGVNLSNAANRVSNLVQASFGGTGFNLVTNGDLQVTGAVTAQPNATVFLNVVNGSLFLASGAQIKTSGSTGDISLRGQNGFFNNEGADALAVSNGGRWLIYAPGTDGEVLKLNGLVPQFQTDIAYPSVPPNSSATPATANGLIAPFPPTPPSGPGSTTVARAIASVGSLLSNNAQFPFYLGTLRADLSKPLPVLNAYEQGLEDEGAQLLKSKNGRELSTLFSSSRTFVSVDASNTLLAHAQTDEMTGTPWQLLTMPQVSGALNSIPDGKALVIGARNGSQGSVQVVSFDDMTGKPTTIDLPPEYSIAKTTSAQGTPELVMCNEIGVAVQTISNGAILAEGTGNFISPYISAVATGNQLIAKAEQAAGPLVTLSDGRKIFVPNSTLTQSKMGGLGKAVTPQMIDAIVAQGGGNLKRSDVVSIVAQGGGNFTPGVAEAIIAAGSPGIVAQGGGNIVAQGGGNIVAQGGGNIVAQGGGNLTAAQIAGIVAQGGGNIVAQGGGNIVAQGGGNIVAQGGGNIVAQGGGNIVAQGGGNIVAQGGGNLVDPLATMAIISASIVAQGGGNIVAQGGGNIVAQGGGNIVAQGGGNIVAQGGGNIVAQGGGNIVAQGGGNIVAQGGGNIVAQGGGNLAPLMANIVAAGGGNISISDVTRIVAQGGGNIVAQGGGNIVAQGGGNIVAQGGGNFNYSQNMTTALALVLQGGGSIVAQGGGNIVAQGGGNFQAKVLTLANAGALDPSALQNIAIVSKTGSSTVDTSTGILLSHLTNGVINTNGSNVINTNGSNVINTNGSNVINTNGSNVISSNGGNVISSNGGNVINTNGSNVISSNGGNVISSNGGNIVQLNANSVISSNGGNVISSNGGN